jgi:hypothetical protein
VLVLCFDVWPETRVSLAYGQMGSSFGQYHTKLLERG